MSNEESKAVTDVQRSPSSPSSPSEDEATRLAREAAMIEAARTEVRNGLAVPEDRFEQWFGQILKQTGAEPTAV